MAVLVLADTITGTAFWQTPRASAGHIKGDTMFTIITDDGIPADEYDSTAEAERFALENGQDVDLVDLDSIESDLPDWDEDHDAEAELIGLGFDIHESDNLWADAWEADPPF
ncbi:MAG TPA: hypothetical protein VHL57_03755 [Flavobacteriales bacterium]|nr:hypothetical protein [Flavobacteriales bacterium]